MPFSPPVFRADAFSYLRVVGAGEQAAFLDETYRRFVLGEFESAKELGWQTPPAAQIRVALATVRDAEWALEEDERKF